MQKISPFDRHTDEYEQWFTKNRWVYEAELRAVMAFIPKTGKGVEIGVGSGRFSMPLGIRLGIEPSRNMGQIARKRGIQIVEGVAENLPLKKNEFAFAVMVTTVCFLDDIHKSFHEAYRILRGNGHFIVGIVDRESPVGRMYLQHQHENVFYREATFYSTDEIVQRMYASGFEDVECRQTILKTLSGTTRHEPVLNGHSRGSFVSICGIKREVRLGG